MEDYSYLFKIILIGDANVGKTCLVKRFTKGFFAPSQGPTIGVDFTIRTVEVDGEKVKVSLYLVVTSSFVILLKRKFGKGRACGLSCMGSKAARAKLLFRFFFCHFISSVVHFTLFEYLTLRDYFSEDTLFSPQIDIYTSRIQAKIMLASFVSFFYFVLNFRNRIINLAAITIFENVNQHKTFAYDVTVTFFFLWMIC